jgi:hypothetical protein
MSDHLINFKSPEPRVPTMTGNASVGGDSVPGPQPSRSLMDVLEEVQPVVRATVADGWADFSNNLTEVAVEPEAVSVAEPAAGAGTAPTEAARSSDGKVVAPLTAPSVTTPATASFAATDGAEADRKKELMKELPSVWNLA